MSSSKVEKKVMGSINPAKLNRFASNLFLFTISCVVLCKIHKEARKHMLVSSLNAKILHGKIEKMAFASIKEFNS
jgi:hypothetical protein